MNQNTQDTPIMTTIPHLPSANEVLCTLNQTNLLLAQILDELRRIGDVSEALSQKINAGIRVQEPVIVEVDGIVAVVGH